MIIMTNIYWPMGVRPHLPLPLNPPLLYTAYVDEDDCH
jgi:hypothetical protein